MRKSSIALLLSLLAAPVMGDCHLNTSSAAAIDEAVKGVGPVVAERIVEARSEGPLTWEKIDAVKGVGEKTLEKLKASCDLE